jgi:hypothetical protein
MPLLYPLSVELQETIGGSKLQFRTQCPVHYKPILTAKSNLPDWNIGTIILKESAATTSRIKE